MNRAWLIILAVIAGSVVIKGFVMNMFLWIALDLIVCGVCYLILKRYSYVDMTKSIQFLLGLTAINILTDLQIIGDAIANILLLALLVWALFGNSLWPKSQNPKPMRHKWHK